MLGDAQPAGSHGKERQHHQRQQHRPEDGGMLAGVRGRRRARLAQEGQADLAHGVESRHQRRQRQHDKDGWRVREGIGQDLIFGPETGGDDRGSRSAPNRR